jgi:hypothetical protein
MRSTELVSFCVLLVVAVACACFGISSLMAFFQKDNPLPLISIAGVVFFLGISIAALLIAWSGWKRPS